MSRLVSSLILGSLSLIVQFYARRYLAEDLVASFPQPPVDYSLPEVKTYDFIIVGGGTAGCVVARRLADFSKSWRVLVLEVGGKPPPQLCVPATSEAELQTLPDLAFLYNTTNVRFFKNVLQDRVAIQANVGKVLGGSSQLNGMVFNRGSPYDFDRWANLTGDQSWSHVNVLKYFKRSETYLGAYPNPRQHGSGGPIKVTKMEDNPGLRLWKRAAEELGYKVSDPNGPQMISMEPVEYNIFKGRRVDAYSAYLRPIEAQRKRLTIVKYAHVRKIEFDKNLRAVGVTYRKHGVDHFARADKEIILSAGALGTPRLLQRSGVGLQDDLKVLGIESKISLPVGKRLLDHPAILIPIIVNDSTVGFDEEQDFKATDVQDFMRLGKVVVGVRPKSSPGTLKTGVSQSASIVDYNFLADPADVQVLVEGVQLLTKIIETTKAYQGVGARLVDTELLACKAFEFRTKEYWTCFVRADVGSTDHLCGTVPMGKSSGDPETVLDSLLRVKGVGGRNVRVIDASIMPQITNSNLQAPVYMIAEKGAELVIRRWSSRRGGKT